MILSSVFLSPKKIITTQKQKVEEWKKQQVNNPNGILGNDIKQYFYLNSEPDAKLTIKQLIPADSLNGDGGNVLWYKQTTRTDTNLAEATYTNLKNSYIIDQDGVQHKIGKIVRTFSNLTKLSTPSSQEFARWVLKTSWEIAMPLGDGATALEINRNPSVGAMYLNASGVTVQDQYYDDENNLINPVGGYYVISSLNHFKGDSDVEKASGSGVDAVALVGSSVSIQDDGSLMATVENEDTLPGAKPTNTSKDWDDANNPNFYFGAGLMHITSQTPSLRFENVADPSISNGGFWFTINTQIPYAPVRSEIHYHYNVFLANPKKASI